MAVPYYYIAVGLLAATTAFVVWWSSKQPVPQRTNRNNSNRPNEGSSFQDGSVKRRTRNVPEPDSHCMICCENLEILNTAKFFPCQHACMCEQCVKKFMKSLEETRMEKKCPYCRKAISGYEIFKI